MGTTRPTRQASAAGRALRLMRPEVEYVCARCGKRFTAQLGAVYCGATCRAAAFRTRRKEQAAADRWVASLRKRGTA